MEGYQCEKVLDKDGVKACGLLHCLAP